MFDLFDPTDVPLPVPGRVHVYEDDGLVVMNKQDWEDIQAAVGFYLGRRKAPAASEAVRLEKMSVIPFVLAGEDQDA